ncbi:MAG: hypothetical protein BHW54_03985 [Subdoligranulum sp. 60_17]|nr:MAG: hypothetical protein BHW54_03985 [Subdoligranulum sp. 60_17]
MPELTNSSTMSIWKVFVLIAWKQFGALLMKQKIYMRQPYNLLVTLKIRLWKCKKMLNTTMSSLYLY